VTDLDDITITHSSLFDASLIITFPQSSPIFAITNQC
jgi:hypothetical protein